DTRHQYPCNWTPIIFTLDDYSHREIICSLELENYFREYTQEDVTLAYEVRDDFGAPRHYELQQINLTDVYGPWWIESERGCGEGLLTCDSNSQKPDSPFRNSSWGYTIQVTQEPVED
ncbi:MAG: hypothetical protein H7175_09180, partial [Burkholderiales bacterium]|nr:hypothetical protein [Anaerolineae bacterium]